MQIIGMYTELTTPSKYRRANYENSLQLLPYSQKSKLGTGTRALLRPILRNNMT